MCCSDLECFSNLRSRLLMERKPGSSRADRKTTERNRRNRMKALLSKLHSLVPPHSPREPMLTLADQLGKAAKYIKDLQMKVEKMREQKERLVETEKINKTMNNGLMNRFKSPEIRMRKSGSILEVVLVTGLDGQFMFNETVRVIHEEGVSIVNANFSTVGDALFHSIHAKVGDGNSSDERIAQRLQEIVNDMLMEEPHP